MVNFLKQNYERVVSFWNHVKLCFPLRGIARQSDKSVNPMAPWRHIEWSLFCILFPSSLIGSKGWASLVAQRVKHLPAMRETWVWSLGQEDPLEKEMVTHSSTLAWKIPWMEQPERLQPMGLQRVGHNWATLL